jgi:hypothetical protein
MKTFLLAFAVFSIVAASISAEERDPTENAALQYWRAFEFEKVVSEHDALTNTYELISEALLGRFTPQTEEYFRRVDQHLDLMRLGAAQPYCEWGPHSHPLEIPHLLKGRSLARLAAARFRHLAASGQGQAAADLFKSAFQMAEHLDDASLTIGILVKHTSQAILIRAAAAELPGLEPETLASIANTIEETRAASHRLGETFLNENNFSIGQLRADAEVNNLAALSRGLQEFGIPSSPSDAEESLKQIGRLKRQVQKISGMLSQPDLSAVQDELEKLDDDTGDFNKVLLNSASSTVSRTRSAEVRLTMFRAAIATMLDGKEALANFPEPYTGKPFEYEAQFRDRFVLRSGQKFESGQELQVGQFDAGVQQPLRWEEKLPDGGTNTFFAHTTPKRGSFGQKMVDSEGTIIHWTQRYTDNDGKLLVSVTRKAMGHDVPTYEGVHYITYYQYRPDGKLDSKTEFFGDGRIRQHIIYRYDEHGKMVGGDVMRDGRKRGTVSPEQH